MHIKNYLKKAQQQGWAIGKFNVSSLVALRAVMQAAQKMKSPVIIETSEKESRFLGLPQVVALVSAFRKKNSFPVALNLDHGKSFSYIKEVVAAGYDMVHFDGSKLSLTENIRKTKEVVRWCRRKNVLVEGEVGIIAGSSKILKTRPKIKEKDLTNPSQARKFVKETGVDSLAINVGTFHGVEASNRPIRINIKRLKEVKEKTGNIPLVLHGGSGVAGKDIKKAVKLGVALINVSTELRTAYTKTLRKALKKESKENTPYKYLPEVVREIQKVVENKIKLFGSKNKI